MLVLHEWGFEAMIYCLSSCLATLLNKGNITDI